MTGWRKRQVLELAERASQSKQDWWKDDDALEAFAKLVREDEREETNRRANASWTLMCEKMVAAEREACAKLCETLWNTPTNGMATEEQTYGAECAEAIRARGQA